MSDLQAELGGSELYVSFPGKYAKEHAEKEAKEAWDKNGKVAEGGDVNGSTTGNKQSRRPSTEAEGGVFLCGRLGMAKSSGKI